MTPDMKIDGPSLPEFDRIVLGDGEYLLLRPKNGQHITADLARMIHERIPQELRDRVLIFDGLDVTVVKG